jgi:hypothetical protein
MEKYKNFDNLFEDPIEIIPEQTKKVVKQPEKVKTSISKSPTTSSTSAKKVEAKGTSGGTKKGKKKEKVLPEPATSLNNKELNDKLDRVLQLAELGMSHELTEENMIHFIKMKKTIKPYELRYYFDAYDSVEIQKVLNSLFNKKSVSRNKNKWYFLTKKKGDR